MNRGSRNAVPEAVNRILFVKNLNYNVAGKDLYELFGDFGPIRQIRLGDSPSTKGTAYVVYDEALHAKLACDKLNGFNFQNRYLVVLFHQLEKMQMARLRDKMREKEAADEAAAEAEAENNGKGVPDGAVDNTAQQ